jgi:hypothetical protein
MTSEQKLKAAHAFWADEEAADDQVQAALLIAQTKKFRAKTVLSLDDERKAKHLASLPSLPETVAARALVVYHLAEQRPMMGAFLDALGIAHENGVIQEDDVKPDAVSLAWQPPNSIASGLPTTCGSISTRCCVRTLRRGAGWPGARGEGIGAKRGWRPEGRRADAQAGHSGDGQAANRSRVRRGWRRRAPCW